MPNRRLENERKKLERKSMPNPADKFKDTVTGANPNQPPTLPGQQGPNPVPGGTLPHTTQVGPRPAVPTEWQNPIRIIRLILDLMEADPTEAASVSKFVQEKLDKIHKGK